VLNPNGRRIDLHHDKSAERDAVHRVTDNLTRRVWEHREGVISGFSKRYGLKRLVYYEHHADIREARQREQNMKHYPRAWKVLIPLKNPNWDDLYDRLM
jgi:putative endonuclease